jgi:hypothetical protein
MVIFAGCPGLYWGLEYMQCWCADVKFFCLSWTIILFVSAFMSVVVPAHNEPLPGWVDTLNGPVGVIVGAGKGVIRTMTCGENYSAQIVPVDIAINCLIIIAWELANEKYV